VVDQLIIETKSFSNKDTIKILFSVEYSTIKELYVAHRFPHGDRESARLV